MVCDRQAILGLTLLCVMAAASPPALAAAGAAPPNPFVDKGACPFECCTFRDWRTNRAVTLLDKPNGTRKITIVAAGTVVRGVTGQVFSAPILLTAAHDYPESPIKTGDVFYALHNAGEGYWAVWFRGKVYSVEFGPKETTNDTSKWWVNIRTRHGKTGWVLDREQFDLQDSCGIDDMSSGTNR